MSGHIIEQVPRVEEDSGLIAELNELEVGKKFPLNCPYKSKPESVKFCCKNAYNWIRSKGVDVYDEEKNPEGRFVLVCEKSPNGEFVNLEFYLQKMPSGMRITK
ncbi:hypothetical protein HYW76_05050 [Candidatus Pacearchaeota archaeon]|nr:hypothetical protein [Candidatus Pacearchaeota archaeon]